MIPVLDDAGALRDAAGMLASLRAQGCEVLVVDGGSGDDSLAVATEVADRVVQAARGRARQMNAGAALARARVLLFLHADTVLPPGAVDTVLAACAPGRSVWGRFDVRLSGARLGLRVVAWSMSWRSRLTGIATGDQGIFVTRDAFDAVGGFPDLALMEDVEISRRLRALGRPACPRARVVTSSRRWERDGVLRTVLLMWRLRLAYWRGADPAHLVRVYYGPGAGRE